MRPSACQPSSRRPGSRRHQGGPAPARPAPARSRHRPLLRMVPLPRRPRAADRPAGLPAGPSQGRSASPPCPRSLVAGCGLRPPRPVVALPPLWPALYPRSAMLARSTVRSRASLEASPSLVYGAALLMRFGLTPIRGSNPRASATSLGAPHGGPQSDHEPAAAPDGFLLTIGVPCWVLVLEQGSPVKAGA